MMIGRTAIARTATRVAARRAQSTSATAPKQHRAKDAWQELEKTRAPTEADELHVR